MSGISTRAASLTTGARTHAIMSGRPEITIRVAACVGQAVACARTPA